MRSSRFTVRQVSGALGAEISGIDLSRPLDAQTVAALRHCFLEHGVIFFRDQELSAAQHKDFARSFGEIYVHPYLESGPDPEIIEIRRQPHDASVVGEYWHSDAAMSELPPLGSILYAIDVPPFGGDTLFSNQYLAYETLSPGMQRMIGGMRAHNSDRTLIATAGAQSNARRSTHMKDTPAKQETITLHPIVRTHPETGRKALYVNRNLTLSIEDMSESESRGLLDYLFAQGERPEFTCRFRWERGSIAFWDNRCTKHLAINDTGGFHRLMRRVQLVGDRTA